VSAHDRSGEARDDMIVTRLRRLASLLDGEPDPAFRAATRARLVAMAAVRTPAPEPAPWLRGLVAGRASVRRRATLTTGLAGAALTVTALAGLVAVADGARPGDVLYELKRGTEQTQLALAGDSRGRTLLDLAGTRLDELESLVGEGGNALPAASPAGPGDATVSAAGAEAGLVLQTVETMDAQTREGAIWLTDHAVRTSAAAPLDVLAEWQTGQAEGLAALQDLVPDAAAEAVGRSLTLLAEIGARADGLQAALDCPTGPAVDGTDGLGPVPVPCSAPASAPPATGGGTTRTGTSAPGGGAPAETTPAAPAAGPGSGGSGSGGARSGGVGSGGAGSGGAGSSGTAPSGLPAPVVPTPTKPGGLLPRLPTLPTTTPTVPSTPTIQLPPVCLGPLAIGDC
jgi:hypothetical protein